MKSLELCLLLVCIAALKLTSEAAPYGVQEENCDENQRTVSEGEFSQNFNAGYQGGSHAAINLAGGNSQKLREHYEKLKTKADQFVRTPGTSLPGGVGAFIGRGVHGSVETGSTHDLSFGNLKNHALSSSSLVNSNTASGSFYNDDSLLSTVEGLKVHGQGKYTATGGILTQSSYQAPVVQGVSHSNGYGTVNEKQSSSSSYHGASSTNLQSQPLESQTIITYTPEEWQREHHSSSLSVQESVKRRNYTDYSKPELISQQSTSVIHPLNTGYDAHSYNTFSTGSKISSNYDNSNTAFSNYQSPVNLIPIGGNDANYLSKTKSHSLSKTLVSSQDSNQGVDLQSAGNQDLSYSGSATTGSDRFWQSQAQRQAASRVTNGYPSVLQVSFGTTESESEDSLHSHNPLALTVPQNQGYSSKSDSQSSSYHSSQQVHSNAGEHSQIGHNQHVSNKRKPVPTEVQVGNPNSPSNSGFAITGENKGFYAKSVELANLVSASIQPMTDDNLNPTTISSLNSDFDVNSAGSQQAQVHGQDHSSRAQVTDQQGSNYGTNFIAREKLNPALTTSSSGYQNGFEKISNQEKSSSSHFEKHYGSNVGNSQNSYSGVPVIDEPYRAAGYSGSSRGSGGVSNSYGYSGSSRGSGGVSNSYGYYTDGRSNFNAASTYNDQASRNINSKYGSGGSQSSSTRSFGSSNSNCYECHQLSGDNLQTHNTHFGTPVKNSFELSSSFSASASNINGKKSESKSASVTINDNGKVDSYSRHS